MCVQVKKYIKTHICALLKVHSKVKIGKRNTTDIKTHVLLENTFVVKICNIRFPFVDQLHELQVITYKDTCEQPCKNNLN